MKKDNWVLFVPLILATLATISLALVGMFYETITDYTILLPFFGGVCFLLITFCVGTKFAIEFFNDVKSAKGKSKIFLILLFLSLVLKALYEISISK